MRELRVMIADDELLARKRITRLVESAPGAQLVGAAEDGTQVLAMLEEEAVDVLLLDIQMPGLDGLETTALLPEDGPRVVFTTAHPQHAVEAFGVGAVDYLLKPVDAARLKTALDRVRERLRQAAPPAADEGPLPLRTRRGVRLIKPGDVCAAVFDGTALVVHTAAGERLFVDATLSDLEGRLPDPPFVRVHRRALVNLDRVEILEPMETGGYVARLGDDLRVTVSRQAARQLRRRLGIARG